MKSVILILIIIMVFSLSCSISNHSEKAVDYFYPLEKSRTYIYHQKSGAHIIIKLVKLEDIIKKRGNILVKVNETIKYPETLIKQIELSSSLRIPEITENYYEYVVHDNLINVKQIFKKKPSKESTYLRGPIKIGMTWTISGKGGKIINVDNHPLEENSIDQKAIDSSEKADFTLKASISEIKELSVLDQRRKCMTVTYSPLHSENQQMFPQIRRIYCRGIGYIGDYLNGDETNETLVEIK